MKANEVLLWLSARHEGSWQQFRTAVEELHSEDGTGENERDDDEFPLHQRLRLDLERLGHVEFFTDGCENGWRVAPPTLAAHPARDGVRAVLCGARSPALGERFLMTAEGPQREAQTICGVPDVLRVVARDAPELERVAQHAGLLFQPDAALAILSHLPPVDAAFRARQATELPVGGEWIIHEFDASALTWHKVDRRCAETGRGVFRFVRFERRQFFLLRKGVTLRLPRAVALYLFLKRRRRDLMRYDASPQALSVPAVCRPPQLLERALVLCSGLPPVFDPATSRLTYADVSSEIARFAAELLRQQLA